LPPFFSRIVGKRAAGRRARTQLQDYQGDRRMRQRRSGRGRAATAASAATVTSASAGGAFALGLALRAGLGPAAGPAAAQPFADTASSAARYTRATTEPRLACSALASLELRDVVSITATEIAAQGNVPAHCRVSGTIAPEIAFEVNLPARWNERF